VFFRAVRATTVLSALALVALITQVGVICTRSILLHLRVLACYITAACQVGLVPRIAAAAIKFDRIGA